MSERKTRPSNDPIYSEADVADFRLDWERAQKERETTTQLARLQGQLDKLPELARAAVREVLTEEKEKQSEALAAAKREQSKTRRSDLQLAGAWIGALVLVIVPIEDLVISHLTTGHP